jgi:asparagine synthase (glutamine-hydrolysing)
LSKYIKGSFIIIVYDELTNNSYLISDRLNALPLYYYYKDNKLLISSSIRMIMKYIPDHLALNIYALIDQLIFDYILNDKTYIKNISQVLPGTIYKIDKDGINTSQYWSVDALYQDKLLNKQDALERLSSQLYENVNLYTSDRQKVLVSLTGGFDGRTNLALLEKSKDDYLCYSYGMEGSKQITIPMQIARVLSINYKPIILDNGFVGSYERNASESNRVFKRHCSG